MSNDTTDAPPPPPTSDDFSWYTPTFDDSAAMTWRDYVALHMGHADKTIAPRLRLKALSNRWSKRDAALKLKGKVERHRLTAPYVPGMYAPQSRSKTPAPATTNKSDEGYHSGSEDDDGVAGGIHSKGGQPIIASVVKNIFKGKQADGAPVNRFSIYTTKKNRRIFTKCLQEACEDIDKQGVSAREALLRGAHIPFDFLVR